MYKNAKGFTMVELALGLFLFAVVSGILLPFSGDFSRLMKARENAREAEVKLNIHTIQIALERYAVDTGGIYPLILYGGDWTDTFATARSYHEFPPVDNSEYAAFRGDYDVLLEYDYLAQYPANPFFRRGRMEKYGKIITNPGENGFENGLEHDLGRITIWTWPRDRSKEYVRREVGGEKSNLMWDVSEGQRHAPWPIIVVPPPEPSSTGFVNPDPGELFKNGATYPDDYQFWLTPGNFYYYAIFDIGGYSTFIDTDGDGKGNMGFAILGNVVGYTLAGYGDIRNPGDDVYNLWGDYTYGFLATSDDPTKTSEDNPHLYVGPDGRRDGVIIVVESTVETSETTDIGQD